MNRIENESPAARNRRFVIAILIAGLLAATDLFAKWAMINIVMNPPQVIPVFPFFNLVLGFNRGVTFGLLSDLGNWGPLVLSALALAIITFLVVWLHRARNLSETSGLAMVIGGAFGNLVDRLQDGAVTDYLDFYIGQYHWPAFNIADSLIIIGFASLIIFGRGASQDEWNSGRSEDNR